MGYGGAGVEGSGGPVGYACHTRVAKHYTCVSFQLRVHFSIYLQRRAFLRERERERGERERERSAAHTSILTIQNFVNTLRHIKTTFIIVAVSIVNYLLLL